MLAIPAVQTFLAQKASVELSKMMGFEITIQKLTLNLLNQDLILKNVIVLDRQKHEMINIGELRINFDKYTVIKGGDVLLDKVLLKNGSVNLITDKNTNDMNFDKFLTVIDSLMTPSTPQPKKKRKRAPVFAIKLAQVEDMAFSYNDQKPDSIKNGFDYYHFRLDKLNASVDNFLLVSDTIQLQINDLKAFDNASGLDIKKADIFFRTTKRTMEFLDMGLEVGNSFISDSLVMNYYSMKDFSNFNNCVDLQANLKKTRIHTQDLALFAPTLRKYDDFWTANTKVSGTVSNITLDKMELGFGNESKIIGKANFKNLPDVDKMHAKLDMKNSVIFVEDCQQYIDNEQVFGYANKFGAMQFNGKFDGTLYDFVANGDFRSALGDFKTDIRMILPQNSGKNYTKNYQKPFYKGTLKTNNFALGKLIDEEKIIQNVTVDGKIEGYGFNLNDLDTKVDAKVASIGLNGYNYKGLTIDGKIKDKYFVGDFDSADPNAKMSLKGEVDLHKSANIDDIFGKIKLKGSIYQLKLDALGLSNKVAEFSGKIDIDTRGLDLENIVGRADIENALITYDNTEILVKNINFFSEKNINKNGTKNRIFRFNSDVASVLAEGDFTFQSVITDAGHLVKEYNLAFFNKAKELQTYYEKKNKITKNKDKNFKLNYEIEVNNILPILQLFAKDFYISPNTGFKGSFYGGDSTRFSLRSTRTVPQLSFQKYKTDSVNINFETYKTSYKNDIAAQLDLSSKKQDFGTLKSENFLFNSVWYKGIIDFTTSIKQQQETNYTNLNGSVAFFDDYTNIELSENSLVQINEEKWNFSPYKQVRIFNDGKKTVSFDDLHLTSGKQDIFINGAISDSTAHKTLNVNVENFTLNTLTPLVGKKMGGLLSAKINVKDVFQEIKVGGSIDVKDFDFEKIYVGNIKGTSSWNNAQKWVEADVEVINKSNPILNVKGKYIPKSNEMDFFADLKNIDVRLAETFIKEYVSDISGNISGGISIKGQPQKPIIAGFAAIRRGIFKVNYLGAKLGFSDTIHIKQNSINIKNSFLTDKNNNRASLNALITHNNFKDIEMDIKVDMKKFMVLNTTEDDNSLYYGNIVATGDMRFSGSPNNLYIQANAKTEKGTKISLPLDGFQSVSESNYIKFVNFSNPIKDSLKSKNDKINLNGIKMDMNLNVTDDASFEIILDRTANDMISGNGNGRIQMGIDTRGDFGMWGDYVITMGKYNFTLMNFVSKEFSIKPNSDSRIFFEGSLYKTSLQINASYDQYTSFKPLIDLSTVANANDPEYSRTYPVNVGLNLTGDLFAPTIKMGFDFKGFENTVANPVIKRTISLFKTRVDNDDAERNRQAFSLIATGSFLPENSFSGAGVNGASRTVSQFLTSQISTIMSQVDKNLEIDVDLLSGANNSNNVVQLRMSYTALDGRLRITRNGVFDSQNQSTAANIIGDWSMEYAITKDGRYRLKMYNKNNQNNGATIGGGGNINNGNTTNAGASIVYTKSFNTWRELFGMKKKNKKKKVKKEVPKEIKQEVKPIIMQ